MVAAVVVVVMREWSLRVQNELLITSISVFAVVLQRFEVDQSAQSVEAILLVGKWVVK